MYPFDIRWMIQNKLARVIQKIVRAVYDKIYILILLQCRKNIALKEIEFAIGQNFFFNFLAGIIFYYAVTNIGRDMFKKFDFVLGDEINIFFHYHTTNVRLKTFDRRVFWHLQNFENE